MCDWEVWLHWRLGDILAEYTNQRDPGMDIGPCPVTPAFCNTAFQEWRLGDFQKLLPAPALC